MKKILTATALGLLGLGAFAGENLFYNSSFELGSHGWFNGFCCIEESYLGKIPTPREVDDTTAVHGKNSVKFNCGPGFGSYWPLTSPDVTLKEGKKYTVSFYAKSAAPATVGLMMYTNHNAHWSMGSKQHRMQLSNEWKRYSFSFVHSPKNEYREPGYDYFLLVSFPQEKNVIHFDAMQIEEGELTGYKPASPVEYKITVPDVYWQDKSEMPVKVTAVSYDKNTRTGKKLILTDRTRKREVFAAPFTMELPKGEAKTAVVPVKNVPYGSLRLQIGGTPRVASETFVKIHENKALYQPGKFAVGMGTMMLGKPEAELNKKKRVTTDLYQIAEGEVVRRSGAVFTKAFDYQISTLAGMVPQKRGQYNWKMWDDFFSECEKYQLKGLMTIAAQSLYCRNARDNKETVTGNVPDWLAKLDRFGKPEGTCRGEWRHIRCVFPPAEVIGEVAGAMAARYGKKAVLFRLFPESNGYMEGAMLAEYAKAVYTQIKKAAPDLPVNSCTPTEDQGAKLSGHFYEFLKAGGGKYCDVYGFHPYSSTQDDSPLSAMDGISALKDSMKHFNAVKPLGELECFYLVSSPKSDYRENGKYGADAVARRLLVDMGEGVRFSAPLELSQGHGTVAAIENNTRFFRRSPDQRFAAHNAMGHFLNGAEDPKRIRIPGDTLCYTFRNHGIAYAAVWNVAGKSTMTLTLPQGVVCEAFDMFGNLTGTFRNAVKLPLNREPQILRYSKGADAVSIHAKGSYERNTKAAIFGLKRMPGGVAIILKNTSSAPISGMIRLESQFLPRSKAAFRNLKAHEFSSVLVPCEIAAGAPEEFEVTVVLLLDGKVIVKKLPFRNVPVIKITEKSKKFAVGVHSFTLRKDGKNLFITASLKSKTRKKPSDPKAPWTGDCVEFFFDFAPTRIRKTMDLYHDQCVQMIVPAEKAGDLIPVRQPSSRGDFGVRANVKHVPGGAVVTLTVPISQTMAMTAAFTGDGVYQAWRGKKNYCNRDGFAILNSGK